MEKVIITVEDLQIMLDCCYNTACKFMREIRAASDTLGKKGICHQQDYEFWLSIKKGKGEKK